MSNVTTKQLLQCNFNNCTIFYCNYVTYSYSINRMQVCVSHENHSRPVAVRRGSHVPVFQERSQDLSQIIPPTPSTMLYFFFLRSTDIDAYQTASRNLKHIQYRLDVRKSCDSYSLVFFMLILISLYFYIIKNI